MLIDTHCHLNSLEDFPDPDADVATALAAGVERLIVVGTDPEDGKAAIAIAERHPNVWVVLGYHPNYCAAYGDGSLDALRPLLTHPKVVALGEIGLDYHWDNAPRHLQFRALHEQLDLAKEVGKPVVFHCREAYPDLLDVLESRPLQPYLIHCFAGDAEDAKRAIALNCLFGVDGPVTYKSKGAFRELLKEIGLERLVLETDSPYLSPVPHRGKPNHPAYIPLIRDGVAAALDVSPEVVAEATTRNALRFFGIS